MIPRNPGIRIMLAYGLAYLACSFMIWATEYLGLIRDIPFFVSTGIGFGLIYWIAKNYEMKSTAALVLTVSLFLSTTFICVQYLYWAKAEHYVYNDINAMIAPILTTLTMIDILAMLWIFNDGINDPIRRGHNKLGSMAGLREYVMAGHKSGSIDSGKN